MAKIPKRNKGCIAKTGTRQLINARKNMFRKGKEEHGWFIAANPVKVEVEGEEGDVSEGGGKEKKRKLGWVKRFEKKKKVSDNSNRLQAKL
jgi:cell division protein FtsI/penicillin-binding protein 2